MPSDVVSAMGRLMFRGIDKLRLRQVFDIREPTRPDFTGFDRARQIVLVTFKRSGEAVPSPVNHGVAEGKLYVRTDASTGKVKRIRNDPRVVVVPCNLRGRPKGQPVAGIARLLPEAEHARADAAIAANWSPAMKVFERTLEKSSSAFDIPMAYLEITPAPPNW